MNNPQVSVIIPVYNGARFIRDAIESVLNQSYKNTEIIIVDDGSTDSTKKILEPYIKLGKIRYFYQENCGPSVARNRGILNSTGEYVAFLDSDDLWRREKLAKEVQYLEKYPEIGLIHSNLSIMTNSKITKNIFQTIQRNREGHCFKELFKGNFINVPTVMIRRECLAWVGLFDPRLLRCQDYELWLRISRHFKLGYINEPLSIYRIHDSNISRNRVLLAEEIIAAIHKILALYPEAWNKSDSKLIKQRLFELYFDAAYRNFKLEKYKVSRRYFFKTWKLSPFKLSIFLYLIATFLPLSGIVFIRNFKQGYLNRKVCKIQLGERCQKSV